MPQIGWTRIQLREFLGPSDFSVIFPGYPGSPYYLGWVDFFRADNPVRCTGASLDLIDSIEAVSR